ncbi:MAG: hypothetical protein ACOX8S_01800 [Christensenellales bacterium]|jgi:hypothetical protein
MAKYVPRSRLVTFDFGEITYEIERSRAELDRIIRISSAAGERLLALTEESGNEGDIYGESILAAKEAINEMMRDKNAASKISKGADWLLEDYIDVMSYILAQVKAARQIRRYEYSPERVETWVD